MSRPIIAACGNDCAACPRYTAHPYEKTEAELRHTAALWMKIGYRDRVVSAEEIACTGCKPENWCRYGAARCCADRGIGTCAVCGQYPCERMRECFAVTLSFEPKCREVCTEAEYAQLKRAFFEKERNLATPDEKTEAPRGCRSLLTSTANTRDLGGIPVSPGGSTLRNRVWRSDAPVTCCEPDERRLQALGITTLVDLRTDGEIERKPCAYAGRPGFTYHHFPITAGSVPPPTLEEVPFTYLQIARQREFAEAIRAVAEAETGVLFCCTAGKDRTGVAAALLLLACGVDRSSIVEDYAVSRDYNRNRLEKYLAEHPETDRRIVLANEASMERFLDLFSGQFGGIGPYFEQNGLSPADLARVRQKLLPIA